LPGSGALAATRPAASGEQNAVFRSHLLCRVNRDRWIFYPANPFSLEMSAFLFDRRGVRKYIVASERSAFVGRALNDETPVGSFCLTLAITGARLSETLALTRDSLDISNEAIVFETLKRRKRGIFRAVPVPAFLLKQLIEHSPEHGRIWPWGRTTAWKVVKVFMADAGIPPTVQTPRAIRHGFAIHAGQNGVPLNIVQRWMGHARIETTAIYAAALGDEERNLAKRCWGNLRLQRRDN